MQSADSLWKKTGSAEIEYFHNSYGLITAITNYSFLEIQPLKKEFLSSGNLYQVIIAQASRNEYGNYEGSFPTLTAEAFLVKDGVFQKPLWKLTEKAHKGEVKWITDGRFYQTITYRHAESKTLYGLYNVVNGKEIFHYSSKLLSIRVPNIVGQVRLIAYEQIMAPGKQLVGALYYSSLDSTLHELSIFQIRPIHETGRGTYMYLGADLEFTDIQNRRDKVLLGRELELWSRDYSNDPKSFTGFSVKLKYYRDIEIVIPIKNGDFDLNNFTSEFVRIERK